jgi:SAM-dependent methyltransferase
MRQGVVAAKPDQELQFSLQNALGLAAPLNTNIHPNDQMLNFIASTRGSEAIARSEYFTSGAQQLKILEQLVRWKFGSFDDLPSLLDFAGGYGRLTRFLVHNLPPDRIWVSDIQAEAVAFQQAEFGVHGFISTADPAALVCDRTFDCIFVASLFSHLPAATFAAWLKKLYGLLKPGGLLAFSLHDESRLPKGETMPDSGIWFGEASEISTLDTKEYGMSIVSEAFVSNAIAEATGRPDYRRMAYGMQYHQDLYLVVNESKPDFSTLNFGYVPHGGANYALWTASGELRIAGWAVDMAVDRSPVEVQIVVDGQLRQTCATSSPRPEVRDYLNNDRFLLSGWECSFHLQNDDFNQVVIVKGVSSTGDESLLYAGTIAALVPHGRVELCYRTRSGELHVGGWAADTSGDGTPVEVQIFIDGQLRQKCLPSLRRPDVQAFYKDDRFLYAGWQSSLYLPDGDASQIMVVKAISGSGDEPLLYAGTIGFLERPVDHNNEQQLQHLQAALDHRLAEMQRLKSVIDQLQAAVDQLQEELHKAQADQDERLNYIHHLEAEIARKNAALANLETRMRRRPWHSLSR